MNVKDEMILETIEDTIATRIARAMRLKMPVDIVYELLNTRKSLLINFEIIDCVCCDNATDDELKEASNHEDISLIFSGKVAEYRGKRYLIYNDDAGQCDTIYMNGQFHSMGAYNFFEAYRSNIGYLAEEAYTTEKMSELFGPNWAALLKE